MSTKPKEKKEEPYSAGVLPIKQEEGVLYVLLGKEKNDGPGAFNYKDK